MKQKFSFRERSDNLNAFTQQEFDLAIVGGGITGAGVARDAASRGMSVALVEAQDFAAGTSSRSSKLIHGGIRYLENLEFHLVFESLTERRRLFEIAPHLVHPLRFILPLYKGGRVGMFKMGLGMWLYDALSMFDAPELHRRFSREEALQNLPMLKVQDLLGAYAYYDAYMDDDRLVIETLRSAAEYGAMCANYVKAMGVDKDSQGRVCALICKDLNSQKEIRIQARHFVSTVGPWTDVLGESFFPQQWQKRLRPSKGIHLTFDRRRIPLRDAVVMAAESRIVFGIPRHEMVIIGTTDTDYKQAPEQVSSERADIEYLLQVINYYFPGAKIGETDILASYSGVRPLVDDGATTESKTSREHLIFNDPRNITFVTGGKYTTYRKMAEDSMQSVLSLFPLEDQVRFGRSLTKTPLNPLATVDIMSQASLRSQDLMQQYNLPQDLANRLFMRHGDEVYRLLGRSSQLDSRLARGSELWCWALEAMHAIETTMCMNIRDFYLRRSPLFLSKPDHGLPWASTLAELFAEKLGAQWGSAQDMVAQLGEHIQHEMSWKSS